MEPSADGVGHLGYDVLFLCLPQILLIPLSVISVCVYLYLETRSSRKPI